MSDMAQAVELLLRDYTIEDIVAALADYAAEAAKDCEPDDKDAWQVQADYLRRGCDMFIF